jgi:hypothetical protein
MVNKVINDGFDNHGDRMIVKLYLGNMETTEIADLAGVSQEHLDTILAKGDFLLFHRIGCALSTLQAYCTRHRLKLL